jgi:hypothetical protein
MPSVVDRRRNHRRRQSTRPRYRCVRNAHRECFTQSRPQKWPAPKPSWPG